VALICGIPVRYGTPLGNPVYILNLFVFLLYICTPKLKDNYHIKFVIKLTKNCKIELNLLGRSLLVISVPACRRNIDEGKFVQFGFTILQVIQSEEKN